MCNSISKKPTKSLLTEMAVAKEGSIWQRPELSYFLGVCVSHDKVIPSKNSSVFTLFIPPRSASAWSPAKPELWFHWCRPSVCPPFLSSHGIAVLQNAKLHAMFSLYKNITRQWNLLFLLWWDSLSLKNCCTWYLHQFFIVKGTKSWRS